MEFRTNNVVESFHQRWNIAVGVRHHSLWNFIRVLKDQQAINETAIEGMRNGNLPPRRKRKWRNLEERTERLKRQYRGGERDINAYWRGICQCVADF